MLKSKDPPLLSLTLNVITTTSQPLERQSGEVDTHRDAPAVRAAAIPGQLLPAGRHHAAHDRAHQTSGHVVDRESGLSAATPSGATNSSFHLLDLSRFYTYSFTNLSTNRPWIAIPRGRQTNDGLLILRT